MTLATFSSLPAEIITLIGINLNRHDLAQCVRVCQQWCTLFTPSLWRDVKADTWFCNEERMAILARNAHFIRDLVLVNNPYVAKLLAFGSQGGVGREGEVEEGKRGGGLRSLVASFEWETPLSPPRTEGPPEQALEQEQTQEQDSTVPSETTPTTNTAAQQQVEDIGNARLMGDLLRANQNLRFISVDESCLRNRDGTDAILLFNACCPSNSLERLELRFCEPPTPPTSVTNGPTPFHNIGNMYSGLTDAVPWIPTFGTFTALKELVISGGHSHLEPHRLDILKRCPNVERVQLDSMDDGLALFKFALTLGLSCHRLSHLELKGRYGGEDEDIGCLLVAGNSQWKEILLPDMDGFGPKAFAVLMKNVRTRLEVLKVEGWGQLQGEDFMELLCSAQHLRRLEGPADGKVRMDTTEFTMWAYSTFYQHTHGKDRSWALGPSMEFLQIWIDDVPRPDVACLRSGDPISRDLEVPEGEGDAHLRYDVQRWVYTQLGRLTGLQELILGVKELDRQEFVERGVAHLAHDPVALEKALDDVPTFIYRSLEFSLESGLDMLAGMKELRFLDVKSTAHRIGVAELDWMHINWPKLKTIRGLVSVREWTGDAEGGLEVKTAVEEWLAAHPRGIGSSFHV
jgi:hypothetical protein